MRFWVPLALVCVLIVAYAYFYRLTALEAQGASSIGMANMAGLLLVFVGVVAAGLIMRRAAPPR